MSGRELFFDRNAVNCSKHVLLFFALAAKKSNRCFCQGRRRSDFAETTYAVFTPNI